MRYILIVLDQMEKVAKVLTSIREWQGKDGKRLILTPDLYGVEYIVTMQRWLMVASAG